MIIPFALGIALALLLGRLLQHPGTCLHGRDWGEQRDVFLPGNNWEVVRQDETGDIDVLPLREDHDRGALCICHPRVDIEGSCLVVIHNSFDGREILEEAVRIMNEESHNGE